MQIRPLLVNEFLIEQGRLDPLALWRVGNRMSDVLLSPFTTVVQERPARYFAFYCWAFEDCLSEFKNTASREFWSAFSAREAAFVCAIQLHGSNGHRYEFAGRIGSESADRILQQQNDPINVITEVANGWSANYRKAMADFDLYEFAGEKIGFVLTRRGKRLAQAFGDSIANTRYYREFRSADEVPRNVLEEYGGTCCPCLLPTGDGPIAKELAILREELLSPAKEVLAANETDIKMLQNSIRFVLWTLSQLRTVNSTCSTAAWRQLVGSGELEVDGGTVSLVAPIDLSETAKRWRFLELQSILVYALEIMLRDLLRWLHRQSGTGLVNAYEKVLKEILNAVLTEIIRDHLIKPVEGSPPTTVGELLEVMQGAEPSTDAAALYEDTFAAEHQAALVGGLQTIADDCQPAGKATVWAYVLVAHLVGRFMGYYAEKTDAAIRFYQALSSRDGDEISLPKLIEIRYRLDSPVMDYPILDDLVDFFLHTLIISRQLHTRSERGKELAWFTRSTEFSTGQHRLHWESDYRPNVFRGPRVPVFLGCLRNLGLLDGEQGRYALSDAGAQFCEEVFS